MFKSCIINDIITSSKIFNGDIFGGAIRDYQILGKTDIDDIDIRLDHIYFKPFLSLLSTKYLLVPIFPNKMYNGIIINSFKILNKQSTFYFGELNIDIVLMTKNMFKAAFIDFDINLLSENEKCLYVRFIPFILKYIPDKISFIKNRILDKTFSYLPFERNILDLYWIIDKAVIMTNKGWTMDDNLHPKDTWIVGKWQGFLNGKHKKNINIEKYHQLLSCNECALCHEKFLTQDVILNTSCNHLFHWECNSTNGLKYWVKNNNSSCPYCRCNMF